MEDDAVLLSVSAIFLGIATRQFHDYVNKAPNTDNDAKEKNNPRCYLNAASRVAAVVVLDLAHVLAAFIHVLLVIHVGIHVVAVLHHFLFLFQSTILGTVVVCAVVE